MDGNGRWANSRGLPRIAGHREGVRTVRKITEICGELDVQILTLYTFSSENWNRPQTEVSALMKLLVKSLRREVKDLMKNNVRFTVIGDINELESNVQNELLDSIQKTKNNTGLNLNLALSYGSRKEILFAVKQLAEKVSNGELDSKQIDEPLFSQMLYTRDIPDPDLLIRTGGEFRLSNFLLWQIAYTEIHVTDTFWPAFGKKELMTAIYEYQNRERRFGKISEQLKMNNG
jgi:undecaprenyl diphosphate synthase